MKALKVLAVERNKNAGVICLSGINENTLKVLGSTLETSAFSINTNYNSVTIICSAGKSGIVAVYVVDYNYKPGQGYFFILHVKADEKGVVTVYLENNWLPAADRIVQINFADHGQEKCLIVKTQGNTFTSYPRGAEQGMRVVPNGDVICQYLYDLITYDELVAASTEVEKKASIQEELDYERMENGVLAHEIGELREEIANKNILIKRLEDIIETTLKLYSLFVVVCEKKSDIILSAFRWFGLIDAGKIKSAAIDIAIEVRNAYEKLKIKEKEMRLYKQ